MDQKLLERLKTLADRHKLSYSKLGQLLGVSKDTAGNYLIGRTQISIADAKKLAEKLGEDPAWLLTGKPTDNGELPKRNLSPSEVKNPDREEAPNYIYLNKQSVQELIEKGSSENSAIPYLDLDIMTIPIKQIVQRTFIPSFRVQLPGFMDSTMMIPVYGESNAAFFSPGTLIICKEIHDHKKLVMGDTYLIFTEEHRFIRRILSQNKEWVTTSTVPKGTKDSHGKVYDGILQEIPLDDLLLVFSIQGHVVRDQI